jgi:predicted phosphodiesterase
MHSKIEVIGTIHGAVAYETHSINAVIGMKATALQHGSDYTGRPSTQLYVGLHDVVKLHAEVRLDCDTARQWVRQTLMRERTFLVHHPHKTWFLVQESSDSPALIGNICPRLTPLHTLFRSDPDSVEQSLIWIGWIAQLFSMSFRVAKSHGSSLDEALSNFGLAGNGSLYYLDDDTYSWDQFVTTAQMIGTLVRCLPWLTVSLGAELGTLLRRAIADHWPDSAGSLSLMEQLRDVCIPEGGRQEIIEAIQRALVERRKDPQRSVETGGGKPLAVMADIHGNLPALEAVLSYLQGVGVEEGIVLGDVVGYGPHPKQCIERLQQTKFIVLKGNHDEAAVTGQIGSGMTQYARWSVKWTYAQLDDDHRTWLGALPLVWHGDRWIAVHGSPLDPAFCNAYVYHMTYEDNLNVLQRRAIPVCFHGHTHMPGVYFRKPAHGDGRSEEPIQSLTDYQHCLICSGSVGQPRNGRTVAQFGIYDPGKRRVMFHQLHYDVDLTVSDMRAAGFPSALMERLREGT